MEEALEGDVDRHFQCVPEISPVTNWIDHKVYSRVFAILKIYSFYLGLMENKLPEWVILHL